MLSSNEDTQQPPYPHNVFRGGNSEVHLESVTVTLGHADSWGFVPLKCFGGGRDASDFAGSCDWWIGWAFCAANYHGWKPPGHFRQWAKLFHSATGRESLYLITSPEEKYKARIFIQMFMQRLAKGLTVLVVIGLSIGIGIFNALFAQTERYQRGSRRSISPMSGRNMRQVRMGDGPFLPCCTG